MAAVCNSRFADQIDLLPQLSVKLSWFTHLFGLFGFSERISLCVYIVFTFECRDSLCPAACTKEKNKRRNEFLSIEKEMKIQKSIGRDRSRSDIWRHARHLQLARS